MDLEVFGEKQLSRELLRVGANASDMRPAFDDVHALFLKVEEKQFSTQGAAYSGGWKPLAPATVKHKLRHSLDPRILHATLRLRKSLTNKTHVDHVFRSSADEMFVGSRVPYGAVHQKPVTSPLPRRRPVEFSNDVRREIMKLLQRHVMGSQR